MSWLSKALKNDTVKIGLTLFGTAMAGKYVFGDYAVDNPYRVEAFGDAPKYSYTGTDIGSRALNALGVKPFQETAVGSFLSPGIDFLKGLDLGSGVTSLSELMQAKNKMPTANRVQATAIRSDTNFQAGQTRGFPVGNNGRALNAMQSAQMQMYLAKKARAMGLPSIQTASANITLSGSGALPTTTAGQRAARKRVVGS